MASLANEWEAAASKLAAFRDDLGEVFGRFESPQEPNEAVTEHDLIRPVLELLGWSDYLPQQAAAGHEDVPDHLLFADAAAKARATARGNSDERFRDALIVQESKRFGLALDQRDRADGHRAGTPHGQMLRYLTTADVASEGRIRFGILTNGSVWRLYDRRARPRASGFFEADLADLLQPGNEDGLRIFLLLFGRDSFIRQGTATTTSARGSSGTAASWVPCPGAQRLRPQRRPGWLSASEALRRRPPNPTGPPCALAQTARR